MAVSSEVFQRLRAKVERAKKQIEELQTAWRTFCDTGAYSVAFKDNAHVGERTYYLRVLKDIPPHIPSIVGDVAHNLRSSLDHLAVHLVSIGTSGIGPFRHVCFPVAENAAKYKAMRDGRVKGMWDEAIKQIDAIEPYGGGAGQIFWHIHELDRIDKHHLLLTVFANVRSHSILPSERAYFEGVYLASHPGQRAPDLRGMFMPHQAKRFPLKTGDELLTIPHFEMEENMNFLLDIAFGEPKVIEGEPVVEMLHQAAAVIGSVTMVFDNFGLLQ